MIKSLKQRGFTLIEIMVVVAIISILSLVILASINEARKGARDKVRISDLEQAKSALHIYAVNNKTYLVAGTGNAGNGQGWFSYNSGSYATSVVQGLMNAGLLTVYLNDPLVPANSTLTNGHRPYMIYFHSPGGATQGVCLFAQLERPNAGHIALFDSAPISASTKNTLRNSYNMNYATCTQ